MTIPALNTPSNIITTAMRHAGKLAEGQLPTSEQFAMYSNDLTRMINLWQTQGLKLWLQQDIELPLIEGRGGAGDPYTFGPGGSVDIVRPLRILQGYYLDSSGNRRPIYPLSWDEWLTLAQTTQTGAVAQYFVDKQSTVLNVYLWLVPDSVAATGSCHFLVQTQVVTPVMLTDNTEFPPEWGHALTWGLAEEICTGQPDSIVQRCTMKARESRMMMEDWDVEDAVTQFQPDWRSGGYNQNNFS